MELWNRINNSTNLQIFLVFLVIFIGGIYIYLHKDICETTITYRIGEIDQDFGITRDEAKRVAIKAENIWEEKAVLDLFEYNEDGEMVINFVTSAATNGDVKSGESFDKGDFYEGVITVYQFYGLADLILLLSHEYGHALGADHVDDPLSIMHFSLENHDRGDFRLTDSDVESLARVCNII